ncbi:alpha/beta hydrolase family protein [Alloacidobacterium dinghuense]|uniref:Alpha/beta hydrolase family protein n=1 Tax=Alloacidobacterium dinghuense TaxID=2763107 RepID=A0A7G8BFB7_9BACT|nr:alpha/beta hydrolase family protein [Alloacidobacterium dinghuense]QNI31237.1 alpha/beta hydrolase family protein [Alloacidobacterium dinghuense]
MLGKWYARWMFAWETALTTRDENRVVRPIEWGFEWLDDFLREHGVGSASHAPVDAKVAQEWMIALNETIVRASDSFFSYEQPCDYRLEDRHPQLFPTNVRPETLAQDAKFKALAADGKLKTAQFLRFTSPVRTPYPENDLVNARWYPAPEEKQAGKPKQAMIVMPQWNADAFSHNALCSLFNRFGISALRLSKPYHDIRRPAELERSDYAVSSNIGRTIAACRQAVVDIRCCLDWLESQGYEQFGILGTSLGSCYAFIASAHDPRLRVNAFNHASTSFGDVVWTGQSTRHIREAFEEAGMTQQKLQKLWASISPVSYMERFASHSKKVLVVHATYDLTFLREYSLEVLRSFSELGVDFVSKVLPCGHYTTGETPYKFIDGWYLGSFVYSAFKQLAAEPSRQNPVLESVRDEELLSR